ncbi:MAG: hypothetical protein ACUVWX_02365 [Kiritimatiellia bacterium]
MPASEVAELEDLEKTTVYRTDKKWRHRREELRPEHPVARVGARRDRDPQGPPVRYGLYDLDHREVTGMVLKRKERSLGRFFLG